MDVSLCTQEAMACTNHYSNANTWRAFDNCSRFSCSAIYLHDILRGGCMYILGISAFYHDSAACILHDGEIVAAAQEERF